MMNKCSDKVEYTVGKWPWRHRKYNMNFHRDISEYIENIRSVDKIGWQSVWELRHNLKTDMGNVNCETNFAYEIHSLLFYWSAKILFFVPNSKLIIIICFSSSSSR